MGRDGCPPRETGPDLRKRDGTGAIFLDFYGTLARATEWVSVDVVLAEHGVELDDELRDRYWNDGLDGIEHLEHSQSRDHYVAWQRERILSMLSETDLHPGEYEEVLAKLRAGNEARRLEAYDEVRDVLTELRGRGLTLAICSNWDWDLAEAVDEAGPHRARRRDRVVRVGRRPQAAPAHVRAHARQGRPWHPTRWCSSATRGDPTWSDPVPQG